MLHLIAYFAYISAITVINDMFELHNPSMAAQKSDNNNATVMNGDTQDSVNKAITVVLVQRESVTEDTKL